MKVTLVAHTVFNRLPNSVVGTPYGHKWVGEYGAKNDMLGEFAGRACYQAWEMPNPATAKTDGYLGNIIKQGHFSVLEHSSATFYIEGVSRSLTHELIRHRHLSYSELSQRYVDVADAEMVTPPALAEIGETFEGIVSDDFREDYEALVTRLTEAGLPRKQAREAARAVMPNATETRIVVTGNFRAWRDFLMKRWHEAADAEIRALAGELLSELRRIAPGSFQDIPETPYAY